MTFKGAVVLLCWAILAPLVIGDTAAGAKIRCGNTLTDDVTLTSSDPVVFDFETQPGDTPCSKDGLVLGDGVTLDCAGLTLRGRGKGIGIHVTKDAEGVFIENCVVDSFATGIQLKGFGFHGVEETAVLNNRRNGVDVLTEGNFLSGVVLKGNGRMGFQVKNIGNDLSDGNVALGNGKDGFRIGGKKHFFDSNFSIQNGGAGFRGSGRDTFFSVNISIGNQGDGLNFKGGSVEFPNDFGDNRAIANGGNGIFVGGGNPEKNFDSGGNRGIANAGSVQCEIAKQPCED